MNSNISKFLEIVEDIKQNITDNQYKTIMQLLMAINKDPIINDNHKINKFILLSQWLDTKLEVTKNTDDIGPCMLRFLL